MDISVKDIQTLKEIYIEYSRSSREPLPWNFEKVVVTIELVAYENELS